MSDYNNNKFKDEKIQLDGNVFTDCSFQNCVLIYAGGPLNFNNNTLDGVKLEFVDAAARTVGLLGMFYRAGGLSKEFAENLLSSFGVKDESREEPEFPFDLANE